MNSVHNFPLRDYQENAVRSIHNAYNKGVNRQLAVLATGLGKTIIFSHLISLRNKQYNKKALIIAHREELLLQAKEKLSYINPALTIGIEQADRSADHIRDDVVIASVQTLGKEQSNKLKLFNPTEYATVIIDEAHHASAQTYKRILSHFGILKNTPHNGNTHILLLGVTATPNRNDNQGIDQIFDEVTYSYGIIDGIQNGWLCRIRAVRIKTDTDISTVKQLAGDFSTNELAQTINNPTRNKLVVKTYTDIAHNRQALVFAGDREHTKALYEEFIRARVKAGYILGTTPREERKKLLDAFYRKSITVLVNAMVLTEGYDNASIEYIFMSRPTQSGILFSQMIGRGIRTHEDKEYVMIVDFVDNTSSHTLKTSASLIGIDATINFQGEDILTCKKMIDTLREKRPHYNLDNLDIKKIDYVLKEVDILQEQKKQLQQSAYQWHKIDETFRIKWGHDQYYMIDQTLTGQYILQEYNENSDIKKILGTFATKIDAIKYADELMRQQYLQTNTYQEPWKNDVPTEAQVIFLKEYGISEQRIIMLNKGEASALIAKLIAGKR